MSTLGQSDDSTREYPLVDGAGLDDSTRELPLVDSAAPRDWTQVETESLAGTRRKALALLGGLALAGLSAAVAAVELTRDGSTESAGASGVSGAKGAGEASAAQTPGQSGSTHATGATSRATPGASPTGRPHTAEPTQPNGSPGSAPSSGPPTSPPSNDPRPGWIARVSAIGIGTGIVAGDIVITRPAAGTIKGFEASCTHKPCPIGSVTSTINCACHACKYSISDGAAVARPAKRALPARSVVVEGDYIYYGG